MSDYTLNDTIYKKFTTRAFATGIPTTLAGTPVVSVYAENFTTQLTAGVTLTADFDGVTGLNHLTIVASSGNGYQTGRFYSAVITTGTVGGVSVVGETLLEFTLEKSAAAINLENGTDGLSALAADIADVPTVAEFNARTLVAADYFDPAVDAVANVTLVATTTTNTDMVGTNNALLAADINLTAGAIDNVTLVATTTTNTDMRGTDGANTLAPDNTGISNNGSAIAALNDFDPASDTVANVTLVATTTTNTDMLLATSIVSGGAITTLAGSVVSVDLVDLTTTTTTTTNVTNDVGITQGAADQVWDTTARFLTASTNFNDVSAAQVNAEMVDVISVDTYAEPGQGAPGATVSLVEKINFLYKGWRNRSNQTATDFQLFNDAGSVVDQKVAVSDNGTTAEKGEVVTGP